MQKSILITGASSGIGFYLAKQLSQSGQYKVFAGIRKSADEKKMRDLGIKNLFPIQIDVQDPETISNCATILKSENLYALVNNAGIAVAAPLEFIPIKEFQEQFDVNVFGLLRVTQACLPLLRETRGRIINIGSISGKITTPLIGAYAASKHAVEAMSDALRRELRTSGILVSLIEPGMVKTEIWDKSKDRAFKLVEKIPKHAQEIYRPMIEKLVENLDARLPVASESKDVYAVVKHALESKSPSSRYLVGKDAKIANALRILPDKWIDALIAKSGAAR